MLKSVTTLTAIFLTAGLAHADVNVADPAAQGLSCSQAREAAWFLGELARTDGNNDPEAATTECGIEGDHYAEFGLDAD